MLYVEKQPLADVHDLRRALQPRPGRAGARDHPPYLTALFSIVDGANAAVAGILRSVVMEEMLHMSIAANVLSAVGGDPHISTPSFVPRYPGPLPMGIGSEPRHPFAVPLKKMSLSLVERVFMVIEEPDDPLLFPRAGRGRRRAPAPEVTTPSATSTGPYRPPSSSLGQGIFTGDPGAPGDDLFFPSSPRSRRSRAPAPGSDLIRPPGRGAPRRSPKDPEGAPAHSTATPKIAHGRRLVPDPTALHGFYLLGRAHAGSTPPACRTLIDNPATVPLPPGSTAAFLADRFDATYTSLLNALHATFNGQPAELGPAIRAHVLAQGAGPDRA